MGSNATRVLGIGLLIVSAAAWAQSAPQASGEQLLSNGFLGDQNSRLSGSQDAARPDAPFTARAADALARKDYGRALAIVRPYRLTDPLAYRYLAGLAYEGQGDYPAARRELAAALKMRKNLTGAQVALGMIEAGHGDRSAATMILQQLNARQAACAGKCADYAELASGTIQIEAALKARPN